MKKILLAVALGIFSFGSAQRTCGTPDKMNKLYETNLEAKKNRNNLYNFLKTKNNRQSKFASSGVVTVPVVVHVLYSNDEMNISKEQILSQLKVLNDDFRKLNADFNTNVPDAFKGVAADMELTFHLATKTPTGQPTEGIVRKEVSPEFDFDNDYCESNGSDAWDPDRYLNIWVGNISEDYLGWAYMPDHAGEYYDGLAIGYKYFGTTGTVVAPFNLGRTATHEIGHYFGLHHIWGENEPTSASSSNCGKKGWSDFCDDTPATYYYYFDTPSFPNTRYVCDKSNPNGAMFMNYMDYVDDKVMGLFTNDQKTIVRNAIDTYRPNLTHSLGVADLAKFEAISVYPNPTAEYISIRSPKQQIDEIEIFGNEGRLIKRIILKNLSDKIDVKTLSTGTYYIRTYEKGNFVKSLKFIKK